MRALLQSRTTLFSRPGGDTIQVIKTLEYLERAGCSADISTELEPDLSAYDLVHIFNLTRPQEAYVQAQNARRKQKPAVLSTIYVSYDEFERNVRGGGIGALAKWLSPSQIEYLKVIGRAVRNAEFNSGTLILIRQGYRRLVAETIRIVDVLLPNSLSELNRLCAAYPESKTKPSVIVPNGVDPALFGSRDVPVPPELEKYRGCVLVVARMEALKGQLQVVRAMRDLPWPLVLIGASAPNYSGYQKRLLKEADANVHFIGGIQHDRLPPFYRLARVHALVSWMETTGLSSLEAAAMGANIVITAKGDARDYFGTDAYYCDPASVSSIREAIVAAYQTPPQTALRQRVLRDFTWQRAAEETLRGYELALRGTARDLLKPVSIAGAGA